MSWATNPEPTAVQRLAFEPPDWETGASFCPVKMRDPHLKGIVPPNKFPFLWSFLLIRYLSGVL